MRPSGSASESHASVAALVMRLATARSLPSVSQPVGEGVSEMRIHHGPGYRVQFVQRGLEVVVLPGGGDESTQARGIASALALARRRRTRRSSPRSSPPSPGPAA